MKPKIQALLDQITSGKLTSDKAKVLEFVMKRPGKNKMLIGGYLKMPHQTVTARLSDLEDLGLIESKGTGRYSLFYFIKEDNARRIHAAKRAAEKLEQWAKKGLQLEVPEAMKNELQTLISPNSCTDLQPKVK